MRAGWCSNIRFFITASLYTVALIVAWCAIIVSTSVMAMMPIAHAQYFDPNSPTPEQLEYCKIHDIPAERCSQETILEKERVYIGPPKTPPTFDGLLLSTMIGSGVALLVGIFLLRG